MRNGPQTRGYSGCRNIFSFMSALCISSTLVFDMIHVSDPLSDYVSFLSLFIVDCRFTVLVVYLCMYVPLSLHCLALVLSLSLLLTLQGVIFLNKICTFCSQNILDFKLPSCSLCWGRHSVDSGSNMVRSQRKQTIQILRETGDPAHSR